MDGKLLDYNTRLNEIKNLQDNWNSYGGKPMTEDALRVAKELLDNIFIAPRNNGGIQIDFGKHDELSILIEPGGFILLDY
jgi:hypothetical protein